MKTSELTGAALDWAVAKCEGRTWTHAENFFAYWEEDGEMHYSTDWAQGGPIIERKRFARMTTNVSGGYTVSAKTVFADDDELVIKWVHGVGDTLLIAAMRCYVASELGDIVEVPKVLP